MPLTIILDVQNPDARRAAKIVAAAFTPQHHFVSIKDRLDFHDISVAFIGLPDQETLNRAVRETVGLAVFAKHRPHIFPDKICWAWGSTLEEAAMRGCFAQQNFAADKDPDGAA